MASQEIEANNMSKKDHAAELIQERFFQKYNYARVREFDNVIDFNMHYLEFQFDFFQHASYIMLDDYFPDNSDIWDKYMRNADGPDAFCLNAVGEVIDLIDDNLVFGSWRYDARYSITKFWAVELPVNKIHYWLMWCLNNKYNIHFRCSAWTGLLRFAYEFSKAEKDKHKYPDQVYIYENGRYPLRYSYTDEHGEYQFNHDQTPGVAKLYKRFHDE